MSDRLYWCSYCEDTYSEGAEEAHEHPKEKAAERQFLGIKQKSLPIPKGRATGRWKSEPKRMTYTRKDAIRAGRPMRFMAKGKMRSTDKA